MKTIDLRSDTVTRPTLAMRQAMMNALVGDDVFGEDPTVNHLQERVADLFGKEAGLFVPSGVMGNEICIKVHTQPGDEIIAEEDSHLFVYETGAPALLSGVLVKTIRGTYGAMRPEHVRDAIRPKAYYLPRTRLICLENTHGRSGGTVIPFDNIRALREIALDADIPMHLDGARIWNASVASGVPLKNYGAMFDSLSVCLSKGLGAPVGSVIVGNREFIERARTFRKIFGGGMRQVGILAAAGLFALDHHLDRLSEDHQNARLLAEQLTGLKTFLIDQTSVQTNMVIAEIANPQFSQSDVLRMLAARGVLLTPERHRCIRSVTHLDVSRENIEEAIAVFQSLFD